MQQSENGNSLQQIQASRWHAFCLFGGKGISRIPQGESLMFCLTFVLLIGHIFASIEKFGSHL